jgi:hypothetical protein
MSAGRFILAKLGRKRTWERIFRERLSEPLHLNLISLFVMLFGGFRAKVYFDVVVRPQHAFALLEAADAARALGLKRFTAVEFGVASGAGLMNMCHIGRQVTRATGVEIDFIGFDNATGMPDPVDYRDHPEYYRPGDFVMESRDSLVAALPPNARLVIGDVKDTVREFIAGLDPAAPLGFVSIDVDYYSSTVSCMPIFAGEALQYLPSVLVYVDDVQYLGHSKWAGEMLAIEEFNEASALRKIGPTNFLREWRLFKKPNWISQIYTLHVFDHPGRFTLLRGTSNSVLKNPYLG